MANYAIGDIQGCFDELIVLLDKVNFQTDKDKFVDISGYNYDRLGKYIQKFIPVIKSRGTRYYVQ